MPLASCDLYVPERLAQEDTFSFTSLSSVFSQAFFTYQAHCFIGACGIAVRILAPLLSHKSQDPAVVVLNNAGTFVISLLSGHLGGANDLSRHLASLLNAMPVITTASDQSNCPSLDLLATERGLRILDWAEIPRFQAYLLEKRQILLYDPYSIFPCEPCLFTRIEHPDDAITIQDGHSPLVIIDWKKHDAEKNRLRLLLPHLFLGLGCRKETPSSLLLKAFQELCRTANVEKRALRGLATITEKAKEPCIQALAKELSLPIFTFPAEKLAQEITPNPSSKAGARFQKEPFSVCEGAALLCAKQFYPDAILFLQKRSFFQSITLAVSGSHTFLSHSNRREE